jgi:propanediol dehydratase small subunit
VVVADAQAAATTRSTAGAEELEELFGYAEELVAYADALISDYSDNVVANVEELIADVEELVADSEKVVANAEEVIVASYPGYSFFTLASIIAELDRDAEFIEKNQESVSRMTALVDKIIKLRGLITPYREKTEEFTKQTTTLQEIFKSTVTAG